MARDKWVVLGPCPQCGRTTQCQCPIEYQCSVCGSGTVPSSQIVQGKPPVCSQCSDQEAIKDDNQIICEPPGLLCCNEFANDFADDDLLGDPDYDFSRQFYQDETSKYVKNMRDEVVTKCPYCAAPIDPQARCHRCNKRITIGTASVGDHGYLCSVCGWLDMHEEAAA